MNDKELISKSKLHDMIYNYIKPELDKCNNTGYWIDNSLQGAFYWRLINGVRHIRYIGARLYNDYWGIYNDWCADEYTNIKIYTDHVEFIEESKFTDFDKEFMRGLYLKIKEFVEGDNNE